LIPLAALLTAELPGTGKPLARLRSCALVLCILLSAGNTLYRFIAFDREARPMARLIGPLPADKKVIGLPYELRTQPDLTGYEVFMHSGCYYQGFKRGYPGFSFASFRFSPIQYRDPSGFIEPGYEWSPWRFIFPEGWQFYDYYLVHGQPRPPTMEMLEKMTLVATEGAWSLYQRSDTTAAR
jgi:hypothetical protein